MLENYFSSVELEATISDMVIDYYQELGKVPTWDMVWHELTDKYVRLENVKDHLKEHYTDTISIIN